jgi:CHASE3 domain sensor protein
MTEENGAQTFIDRQLTFNKDMVKTIESLDKAIRIQSKLNQALTQQLNDQDNRIRTHRQLLIGVTFGGIATTLAVILVALA